jgi:hypothetical protein
MMEGEAELDRCRLYELIWSEPVSRLAERFGYSDVGFSKLCQKLNIPVPQRGHWARVSAGQDIRKPRLSPPNSMQAHFRITPLSEEERQKFLGKRSQRASTRRAVAAGQASPIVSRLHPLANAAKQRLGRKEGWSNPKGLRSAPTEVLDIEVTEGTLDRAANIASTLLLSLEQLGATIEIDPKKGRSLMDLRGARLGLKISESVTRSPHQPTPAEERAVKRYRDSFRWETESVPYPQIPQYDFTPTGLLTITALGWPERNWRDTKRTQLEQRIPEAVSGIVALAEEVRDREAEAARKKAAHARKVEIYQAEIKRRADERAAYLTLRAEARQWAAANQLRSYIQAQEDAARRNGLLTTEMALWLEWAARKADWIDPTVLVSDAILDAPVPENPGYGYW